MAVTKITYVFTLCFLASASLFGVNSIESSLEIIDGYFTAPRHLFMTKERQNSSVLAPIYAAAFPVFQTFCYTGVWIYRQHTDITSAQLQGSNIRMCSFCGLCQYAKFQHVLPIGNTRDSSVPVLTLFSNSDYQEDEPTVFTEDTPALQTNFNSLILTGNKTVILHTLENYQGLSYCVQHGVGLRGLGTPIPNMIEIGLPIGTINSFRFIDTECPSGTDVRGIQDAIKTYETRAPQLLVKPL